MKLRECIPLLAGAFLLIAVSACSTGNLAERLNEPALQGINQLSPRKGNVINSVSFVPQEIDLYQRINHLASIPVYNIHQDGQLMALLRPGVDGDVHFVQSYFSGVRPPNVTTLRDAQRYVANLVSYRADKEQFKVEDAWQTSAQTLLSKHGDCEDHAILLADILIRLGYDARVGLGDWKEDPHAWVMLVAPDGELLLIESTEKTGLAVRPAMEWRLQYGARFMFNDTFVWVLPEDRDGMHVSDWERTSRFLPERR